MATNIARLNVDFIARTGRFSKGVHRMQKDMRGFTKSARSANAILGKLAAFGAGTVGVASMSAHFRESAQRIDNLAKTSDKLGIPIERLHALRVAASQTGVETRQLDTGIQRMTRRISEAAKGSGEARGALMELGLSAKQLNRQNPADQFFAVAKAMKSVDAQSDKVRLSMRLFDSEGVGLVNTLALGEDRLEALTKKLASTSASLSRLDAAKVERMNDAFSNFDVQRKGFFDQATAKIAPTGRVLARFGESVASFAAKTVDSSTRVGKAFDFLTASSPGLIGALASTNAWATRLDTSFNDTASSIDAATQAAKEFQKKVDGINEMKERGRAFRASLETEATRIKKANQTAIGELREFQGRKKLLLQRGLITEQDAIKEERRLRDKARQANPLYKMQKDAEDRAKSITEALRTPVEVYKDTIKDLQRLAKVGLISEQTLARGTTDAYENMATAIESARKKRETVGPGFEAEQVRFARTAFGPNVAALNGSQSERVRERQLNKNNQLLEQIARNTNNGLAVAG